MLAITDYEKRSLSSHSRPVTTSRVSTLKKSSLFPQTCTASKNPYVLLINIFDVHKCCKHYVITCSLFLKSEEINSTRSYRRIMTMWSNRVQINQLLLHLLFDLTLQRRADTNSGRSHLPFSPKTRITLTDGTIQAVKTCSTILTGLIFAIWTKLAPEEGRGNTHKLHTFYCR